MLSISNFEYAPFGVALVDEHGCVTAITDQMRTLVGELVQVGCSVTALQKVNAQLTMLDSWIKLPDEALTFTFEHCDRILESQMWKASSSEFVMTATDITAKVSNQRRLELLVTAVDQAWESICITEAEMESPGPRFVYCNQGFTALTGYEWHDVIGLTPRILQGPLTDKSVINRLKENLKNGENFHGSTINYRKDGSPFYIEWKISAVKNALGTVCNYIAFQRDVTELRESERRVTELHSILVHELRAPLTSVNGALGLLQLEVADNELAKELVEIALSTSKSLVDLITDVLDLRYIETGTYRLKLEKISADQIMLRAAEVMKRYREDVFIESSLANDEDIFLMADPARLNQVLINLLSNAIKYSPSMGTVHLRCSPGEENNSARFTVSDTGPGMTEDNLKKLFEHFSRVEAADGSTRSGTGLGLAISKSIVEAHGGTISVESTPGVGTTVWFQIPVGW